MFCRYTESEMLFRQIVGRVLRVTPGDDGTAASVHLPTFSRMKAFADNMNGECLDGVRDLACKACGEYPCVCPCPRCGSPRRGCGCGSESREDGGSRFVAVELAPVADGGVIDGDHVEEDFVQVAGELAASLPSFAHINRVQFGKGMQFWAAKHGRAALPVPTGSQQADADDNPAAKAAVCRRIVRAVNRLAELKYGHLPKEQRYAAAWNSEFEAVEGVRFSFAKENWRGVERLEKAADKLDTRVAAEARRKGR